MVARPGRHSAREVPAPGDVVVLLGGAPGATVRRGHRLLGHDARSLEHAAEVQGQRAEERKPATAVPGRARGPSVKRATLRRGGVRGDRRAGGRPL